MSDFGVLLSGLDLAGNPSLAHIKAMAASVKPEQMERLANQLDRGHTWGNRGSTRLEGGITKAVTGWKGQAADAASVKVAKTSVSSQETSAASSMAAAQIRNFAADVRSQQAEIKAIPTVDTSLAAAAKDAGVGAVVPAVLGAKMLERKQQADKNRDQAAKHLDTMNADGSSYGKGDSPFQSGKVKADYSTYGKSGLPKKLSMSGFPPPPPPPPTQTGGTDGTGGTGGTGGSGTGPGGTGSGSGSGGGASGGVVTGGGSGPRPLMPGYDGTTPTGTGFPTGTASQLPSAASAGPAEGGGLNPGLIGGLAAGGGALAAAGGLAGRGRAPAATDGAGGRSGDSFSRGGAGGLNGGPGTGVDADGQGSRGLAGRGGVGGLGEAAESAAMRSAAGSSALAGEAAGSRGFLPGGTAPGAAGAGNDDDELERRPDYLVSTDDIWGDGRLAAPPVLG